jgi:hypothetical protein
MEIRETRIIREWLGKEGTFWKNRADESVKKYFEEANVVDGVVRWNSNGKVPPQDLLELWAYVGFNFSLERSMEVRDAEQSEFFKQYREERANQGYSQEQLFEMRAAFGAGATVVNAITGEKITL